MNYECVCRFLKKFVIILEGPRKHPVINLGNLSSDTLQIL